MNKAIPLHFMLLFCSIVSSAQSVGIGTTTPNRSAKLDVQSNNSGFLPPRMTLTERDAIASPAQGLMVYCTDCVPGGELSVYNGTTWKSAMSTGAPSSGTPPLTPTNLSVSVSSPLAYASLSWTDISANESGYRIERKIGTGSYVQIGQVIANTENYIDSSIQQSTTYTYRVYAFNAAGNSLQYSNIAQIVTFAVPVLTTTPPSNDFPVNITTGGNILSDRGSPVTSRGVCWSPIPNPTVNLSPKTIDGSGSGIFSSIITPLSPNTTYYIRAYATNDVGTGYGQETMITTSSTVYLSALLGFYHNTVDFIDGNTRRGPYSTNISSLTQTSNTTADIVVEKIFDSSWAPIRFKLDWTDSSNPIVTLDRQMGIGIGSTLVGPTSPYANWQIMVAPHNNAGTFSFVNQTLQLRIKLGVLDPATGQGGFFSNEYIVNMAR